MKMDLSELPIASQQYKSSGILALSFGLIAFLIALPFFFLAQGSREAKHDPIKVSGEECTNRIKILGFKPILDGSNIRIIEPDITNTIQVLGRSSQALSICPSWLLQQYCLGSGCEPPGLNMVLHYQDIKAP